MSKVYTDPSNYSNIAAAIREKVGGSTQYKPNQMADAIRAIETEPVIEALSVTENGSYTAPEGVDGYSPVTVNVPQEDPDLVDVVITENGTYEHSGHDGYDTVTVNVSSGAPQVQVLTSNKAAVVEEDAELAETVAITNHGVIDDPTWSIEAVEGAGYGFALNDAGLSTLQYCMASISLF